MWDMLKRSPRKQTDTASVGPGQRVYAIGDVHGRLDLFDALLKLIDADDEARGMAETQLVFLGDLIDRGPDSAGVVDRVMMLKRASPRVRVIAGNHEEVFLDGMLEDATALRLLLKIGGMETLLSYGVTDEELATCNCTELATILHRCVPASHMAFLRALEDRVEFGDYLFVHAGIRPGRPIAEQVTGDLRWIRKPFLESTRDHGRIVVHGHTPTEEPELRPNRIGIDTGAWHSGRLTALGLEGEERWFLSTAGAPRAAVIARM